METICEISALDGLSRSGLDVGYRAATALASDGEGENKRELLRVLHVINGEYYSGAERVQDNLALTLDRFGFEVVFACVKDGRFEASRRAKKSPLYRVPMREMGWRQTMGQLSKVCAQERISLLHAHTPRTAVLCAGVHGRTGLPWVYHAHSPTLWDSARYLKNIVVTIVDWWAARQADRIIAVAESLRRYWIRLGIPAQRVVTVPNGVAAWDSLTVRKPPVGAWVLGTMALFRPRKGAEVLLKAVRELVLKGYKIRVLAVGPFESEAYERHLRHMTHHLGLDEIVTWTGFVEDTREMFMAMDLFVLPSLFGEGMPMVLLEAMAAGLPVVASAVEGVPEIIRDGREGFLVQPGSPSSLASAIARFLEGAADWESMRRAAYERQRERFSLESMAAGVAAVYRDLTFPERMAGSECFTRHP
ncbi:glycosyltransferase family 4 protein [Thermogutta sp.]|uniref:glycosyltransferase family 4 protein n=1 Tax=Thermogutta sp. TaxID=1962930 RepID=UPI003C7A56D4